MDRQEATNLLKEIALSCGPIGERSVMLMPPKADDVLAKGYQLHIKSSVSEECLACMENIAKQHNLSIKHEPANNLTVIYRPITATH